MRKHLLLNFQEIAFILHEGISHFPLPLHLAEFFTFYIVYFQFASRIKTSISFTDAITLLPFESTYSL